MRRSRTGERWPKIGAVSRSENSCTETSTTISANPDLSTTELGRQMSANGNTAIATNVQPSVWCRNAERAKSHEFCSCTRNAVPVTANASGQVSRHHREVSRPRTRASSQPPAAISTSAHDPCAYMWIAEFV